MYDWVEEGRLPTPDDDLAADMYDMAGDRLAAAGFDQYEISNWARPGRPCRHNLQYWRNLPYVGLGPGAHGYAAGKRYWVLRSPQRYIECLTGDLTSMPFPLSPAVEDYVELERHDEIGETLMMGLRLTKEGIGRDAFVSRFGVDVGELYAESIDKLVAQGLLEVNAQRLRLTSRGRFLSNAVLREFV
jgi:oxygen-independent coproporphyrinogen-3 oxidase